MFSVIVPVFNRDPTPALRSVQVQTFRDWECLVVDDGSANGDEVEAAVGSMLDNRFRYIRRKNGGGGAARNTGIDEAKGAFVAFLDSDDLWLPRKLEIQVEQCRVGGTVAYCQFNFDRGIGTEWIRPRKGPNARQDIGKYLFIKNRFIQTSTIALSAQIAKLVRWDEDLKRGQDWDFVLRLRALGCIFDFIPEPLVIFRDLTEDGRTSRAPGIANHLLFLERNAGRMSWRSRVAYRATAMAPDLAKTRPLAALRDLMFGLAVGVSPIIVARKALRSFIPAQYHRKAVDVFVGAVIGRRCARPNVGRFISVRTP